MDSVADLNRAQEGGTCGTGEDAEDGGDGGNDLGMGTVGGIVWEYAASWTWLHRVEMLGKVFAQVAMVLVVQVGSGIAWW